MLILVHVAIALSSMISASYLMISPSRNRLYVTYGLIGATLLSGTYLVISTHSPLLGACALGLLYIFTVVGMVLVAQHRLAAKRAKNGK